MVSIEKHEWEKGYESPACSAYHEAKGGRFAGKSWLWQHESSAWPAAYPDKAKLIEEVWGDSKKETTREPVYEWVWHGENRDVDWVATSLATIIADELTFCQAHDVGEPELPGRHDYAHWAYLMLDSGYGEVPNEVIAAALDQVGYGDEALCPATSSNRSER
jgi:hypothetical protein